MKAGDNDTLLVEAFYQSLYNYRFQSADSILRNMHSIGVNKDIIDLSNISYSWWRIISGENSNNDIKKLFKDIESSIKYTSGNMKPGSASQEQILRLIMLYSYKSRLCNVNNSKLAGFSAFRQSFEYFELLKPCIHNHCDLYNFVSGLYYALGGHIADEFPPSLLGINKNYADKNKGYKLLELSTSSDIRLIKTESNYFLSKLYLELQENPEKASRYTQFLINQFPDNLVFRYNHLLALHASGKFEEAEAAYQCLAKCARENDQLTLQQQIHFEKEYTRLRKK